MDLAFKIALYAFAGCGVWFVTLTIWHVVQAVWPKIVRWLTAERAIAAADLSALEARLAALEAKAGVHA